MSKPTQVTRRDFLKISAAAAAGGLVAGCAPATTPVPPTKAPAATSAPAATAVPTKAPATAVPPTAVPPTAAPTALPPMVKGEIRIVPTSVKLPKDKVTFRWLDSGDTKAIFWKKYFELYQKAYPNITCQYDGLPWNEIAKIVPVGIQNGNLHDCFSLPQGVTPAQAVAEGWIRPMDDLIPDIKEHKAKFPPASFVEGINVFGGKTYAFPHSTSKRSGTMLLYNEEYMQKAGFDPVARRFTWNDYRAAAKKITEQGAGKYYGLIIGGNQLNRWADNVRSLANIAGAASDGNNINLKTGEYFFMADQVIAAIELLLAIKSDGSIFPGFLSINAPQARANISQGNAGMILQGLWCLPQWKTENPKISYGTALTPAPNTGTPGFVYAGPGGNNEMWIYAKSKVPEIAADILYYRTTLEGQYAWNKVAGVSDPGIFPQALETASTDPKDIKALQLQESLFKIRPDPLVRNPEIAKVNLELKAVTPSFEQVIQGLMSGQLTDVKKSMQSVKDAYEKELDRAIKAAQDKGAKVSRDDYKFPNWDPTKDYLDADYAALKK